MDAYRDQYAKLFNNGKGVQVFGISFDPDTALASWAKDANYPVTFLSDPGAEVGKKYGVAVKFGELVLDSRVLYVIDPTGMSGRVGAIDGVHADPNVIYVGAATGGLWKSTSGGVTWTPLLDDYPASSIGSVSIFQPAPDIVWVGTGERNLRNSAGVG